MNRTTSETSIPGSLPLASVAAATSRSRSCRMLRPLRRFLGALGLAAVLTTGAASAQNLDCVCLAQQSVLFTNGCVGVIPDLCLVVSNCWFPTAGFTSFTCIQNPPAGTVTTSNIFISFTLFAQPGNVPFPCGNLIYNVGFTTNRFTLICPTNQIVPCNTTNFTFYGPAGWTNVPPCCTNTPVISGPFIVTNWPVLTATWIGTVCGVVDVCQESILFGGPPPSSCPCLTLVCPSNIVIQTCLNSTAGTGFTNVFYPLPVVSNTCIGTITNLVMTPPSGSPFPLGTNTVSCTVYDNLGNSATCNFDVIVLGDNDPPIVTCGPNQTVQCGSSWAPIPPTAFDACCGTTNQIMLGFAVTNSLPPCVEVIDFIWHVTDCNGNYANCTNTVTIIDTTPPVIACSSNQVYQCGNTAGLPGGSGWTPMPPSATDNCCLAVTVSLFSAVTNTTSPCNEIITFVWSATDCCTNTSYCTETITITDTNPPVLNCQPFRQIECGASTNWFGDYPTALDDCCGTNVTFTLVNVITNIQTTCFSSYTLTWTATDCCTNTSGPCVQQLFVVDTMPPAVICASNITVNCGSPWAFTPPTAIDDCCTNPPTVVINTTVTNVPANCPTIVTRDWLVTDCCGNTTNCSQTVTIVDNIPPVITCNSNQVVQCGSAWTLTPPTATDNCCTNTAGGVIVSLYNVVTNLGGPCNETITATWEAADCCGNKSFCTEIISIVDTIPPVIVCNSNQTYQCTQAGTPGGWILVPPLATDACCGTNVIVSLLNAVTNGSVPCNEIITLTWQAVDCCTNFAYCTEVVTITDTNPPILICAGPKTVECGSGWTFDPPTAFDLCCGTNVTITVLSNVTIFASSCTNIYEQYWLATDCCTNTSPVCSQRVIEIDSTPPVMTCAPNLTIQCGTPLIFTPPTAVDACCPPGSTVVVSAGPFTNALANCQNVVTMTWQATDCCGNATNCSQSITIVDTIPPVITCGPNQTVQCGTSWTFNPPTVTDNCCLPSTGGTFLFSVTTNNTGPCSDTITAIWKAVDCCGNTAICTNFVNVVDTIPPVITCNTNIAIVQCGSPIIPPPATDNCCLNVTVTVLSSVTNIVNSCRYFVTNTWQAVDCCTNTASCVETIMITDTTPPVLTCASNKTIQCSGPWSFDPPTASDACCGNNVTVTILNTITNVTGPCLTTFTRTWQATDCCTNIATCSQVVTLTDTVPPVITCAPNKTVQCGLALNFDPPTAFDACCGNSVTITVLSTVAGIGTPCSFPTTRTWQATDCCGNTATCSQTITTVDTIPPTILCAANFTVSGGTPWNFTTPSAADNCCLSNVVIMSTTTNVIGACQVVHTRTWKAVDCCGLSSPLCSQSVTVTLTPPPNDPCTNPFTIVLNAPYICGSNICATPSVPPGTSFNVPPCGLSANAPDVWYTVTAVCTAPMTVDTCQPCAPHPTFDTVLSAYTGNCGSLVQVPAISPQLSCNDDACGLRSIITFPAVAGQTYRIRVSGYSGATGWFSIRAIQSTTPPVNDLCANAIPVTVGNPAACGSTLCGATPTPSGILFPTPCGASANTPDVWYRFTPQCSGPVTMNTCGTCPPAGTFDTVLSVYTGTCPGPLNQVAGACNDDSGPFGPCAWTLQSYVSFNAVAGVTYYVRVSGWNLATGNFRLNINQTVTPPANDLCVNATSVPAGTWAWNNCGANTDGPGTPCGLQNDVWFNYTAPCNGIVTLNTCLSSINTVLAVYSGPCNALGLINCNDNAVAGPCNASLQSYLTFNATAGTTYRIRVGGFGGAMGGGVLNITGPVPAANTCPPLFGATSCRVFQVLGPGVGTPWAWSISSPCCANFQNLSTPGTVGSPAALATAFANSINAVCPGTAFSIGPFLIVCLKCGPSAPVTLAVGPAGTPAANLCVVSGSALPTTGLCSFNPEIVEAPVTGQDANNNGYDDYIDIVSGTSADVNGNMIPDEAETCFGPQVTAKPESQLVEPGQNVTLGVSVSGTPPFTYQWLLNGQPIAGATSSNLTINPVTTNDLGAYSVTVSNDCGSLEGTAADLFVQTTYLPVITDANLADGWFRFMVETKIGFNYVIEYKNSLTDPTWTTLTNAPGIGAPQFIYDGEPPPQQRFYRVIQQSVP